MCYLLTATITRENTGEVFETFCPPQWEKDQNKNGDHFILLGECGPWAVFDTPALQTFGCCACKAVDSRYNCAC